MDLYLHPIMCAMPQKFAEKTVADGQKSMKFVKVFSLESFPLYGIVYKYSLRWNKIGDDGAKYFADVLKKNSTLTQLQYDNYCKLTTAVID